MDRGLPSKAAMMTQIRREVSLDSQCQGSGGGSLANSRLTLSSRDTPISVKSASLDLVDESIQVDLSADTITYDSDDEMVKRRVSILRNKKGHPIYSREDIREQYCINKKEVEVLENARSIKLFGCLTNPHESSPCSKNSILFSCMQKTKESSEENVYLRTTTAATAAAETTPMQEVPWRPYDQDEEKSKDVNIPYEERSLVEGGQDSGEDEYILSGFRKRPKTFCHVESKLRHGWVDVDSYEPAGVEVVIRRGKLESSASLGSTSQQSFDSDRGSSRNIQRPSHLSIGGRSDGGSYFQPSRSVDELNDAARRRDDGDGLPGMRRIAKTPDISLDDRRQKHVSFDNNSLIRSNTVGGGLEDVDTGPAATSTPLNTQRRAFSPPARNRSQERLLDRTMRPISDFVDRTMMMSTKPLDVSSGSSAGYRGSLQHRPRRALMKTQATQTELTFKARFMLPAYLTLSPRATNTQYHHRHRAKGSRHRSASQRLTKSQSAYGALGSDESDEEVMEIDLVSKHHRLLRSSTAKASISRQKAIESSQEEIMVSFKPASPPKARKEVLLGEWPIGRSAADKERKQAGILENDLRASLEGKRPIVRLKSDESTLRSKSDLESVSQDSVISRQVIETVLPVEKDKTERSIDEGMEVPVTDNAIMSSAVSSSSVESRDQRAVEVEAEKPSPEESSEISGERSPSGRLIRFKVEAETMDSSSAKSSTDSSLKAKLAASTAEEPSSTQVSDADFSTQSDESPTMTTEGLLPEVQLALETAEKRRKEYLAKYHQVNTRTESQLEMLTSPDSESSSSIFTERETSRSEVSTSSSNKVAKSASSKSETEGEENSESSDYVTATEHSHDKIGGSRESFFTGTQKNDVTENGHTSFESASSASLFSSPSSRSSHAKSSTPSSIDENGEKRKNNHEEKDGDKTNGATKREAGDQELEDVDKTPTIKSKLADFQSVAAPTLSHPRLLDSPEDHQESSDESTKKEPFGSESEEEGEVSQHRFPTYDKRGTPESDRTSDITPVFDPSPEPSSLQDAQTVIEIKSEATSDELLESMNGSSPALVSNNEEEEYDDEAEVKEVAEEEAEEEEEEEGEGGGDAEAENESESTDSSSVFSGVQDMDRANVGGLERCQIPLFLEIDRKPSDELSTVSEVSEENSHLELAPPWRTEKRMGDKSSPAEETDTNGEDEEMAGDKGEFDAGEAGKKSSSSEYIPSETTTPSFDSTTSGSFILESGSYAENESYNSLNDEMLNVGGSLSEKSIPEVSEEERPKSDPVHKYSEAQPEVKGTDLDVVPSEEEDVKSEDVKSEEQTPVRTRDIDEKETEKKNTDKKPSPLRVSATSEQQLADKVGPSSTLSSSSLTHRRYSEDTEHQPHLSTWCSEGAIPKQRMQDGDTKKRREKQRMKSEGREPPPSLHLAPPDLHSRSRSKSRSPEKSEDELESSSSSARVLCSQCGEKIKDQAPLSAPPPGMWDRQYQRSFWEPPPVTHVEHHQPYMWRPRERERMTAAAVAVGSGAFGDLYGQPTTSAAVSRYAAVYSQQRPWTETVTASHQTETDLYADEDEDAGIHTDSYRTSTWIYVTDSDELAVWKHPIDPEEEVQSDTSSSVPVLMRSDSVESTSSEHEFLKQYQAVTHRMIHRKSSVEMYKRLAARTFEVDKRVMVQRNNGEFGFRIHGSKPVVVSAIERSTPAETCGLEVGDIIVSINGINVLDASHSEVVRIAHTGTDTLKMEVTRTCHVLAPVLPQLPPPPVFTGFLQRLSVGSMTAQRWCRRWFVIRIDGVLYWYRTNKDHEPLGALVLQNQTISRVPDAGSPHAFKVSRFGGCTHYFSADDEEIASRWISALNQVAATASRVDQYMETSVRNAQLPTSSFPSPDCQGFLGKLSQRWKSWKRRYFLLKDASLYFYSDRNATAALGMFHLHGYKVQSCSLQGKKNTFEAIPPEPRLKHLYFLADSENEKKRWLAALEYSIDRWIKVG